ncbi:MAG: TlpA family protein disulfide reductase [Chitinophagaceae bacterium]
MKKLATLSLKAVSFLVVSGCIYSCVNSNSQSHLPPPGQDQKKAGVSIAAQGETSKQFNSADEIYQDWRIISDTLYARIKRTKDDQLKKALSDSSIRLVMIRNQRMYDFISTHEKNRKNFQALRYLVLGGLTDVPSSDIASLYQSFPDSLKKTPEGKLFASRIRETRSRDGMEKYDPAILEIPFSDTTSRSIMLKDIPAKYILLDFWASWCAPCRTANREMIKQTQAIGKNGLVAIVAFSLDDKRAKWIKATREDGLNYLSVSDLKAMESPMAAAFNIGPNRGIPYNVLINKEGKIIATDTWGEKLMQVIASLPQ